MDVCQIFLKLFTQFSTGQVINFLYKRKILCGIFLSKRIPSGTLYNIKVIFLSRSLMLLCGSSIKHHINPLEISFTRGKKGRWEIRRLLGSSYRIKFHLFHLKNTWQVLEKLHHFYFGDKYKIVRANVMNSITQCYIKVTLEI